LGYRSLHQAATHRELCHPGRTPSAVLLTVSPFIQVAFVDPHSSSVSFPAAIVEARAFAAYHMFEGMPMSVRLSLLLSTALCFFLRAPPQAVLRSRAVPGLLPLHRPPPIGTSVPVSAAVGCVPCYLWSASCQSIVPLLPHACCPAPMPPVQLAWPA
jgi:hypothetical protein